MDDRDRRELLEPAGILPGGVWADLGAGTGLFTLCLARILGSDATLWAVDRDADALAQLARAHGASVGRPELAALRTLEADFLATQDLPPLDGVLMANSLHYATNLVAALVRVVEHLKPGGALLVVEYDAEVSNPWVPHPVPFARLAAAAPGASLAAPRRLARVRSRYHGHVYSALARRTSLERRR